MDEMINIAAQHIIHYGGAVFFYISFDDDGTRECSKRLVL